MPNLRNIYIIGAQCTGKTTLVNALEEAHAAKPEKPSWIIREVARTVLVKHQFTREDITTSPTRALQLQEHILEAQFQAEEEVSVKNPASWYISDRSGLDPIVYANVFVGEDASTQLFNSAAWESLERRMKAGTVVLCEAGCTWLIDDGTRLMPTDGEDWMRVDRAFRHLLDRRGIAYSVIQKDVTDLGQRVKLVEKWHLM